MRQLSVQAGFNHIEIKYFQRYGLENVLGWCLEKRPNADIQAPFFQREIDAVWRSSCASHQAADYVVLYAKK